MATKQTDEPEILLGDRKVREWLEETGARIALMDPPEFVDAAAELDSQEDVKELAHEIAEERSRVERGLQDPAIRKTLFPTRVRGFPTKRERIHEAMRPAREAARIRARLGHEYTTKKLALENYALRLFAEGEAEGEADEVLLLVRPGIPAEARRVMEARRAALREELAGVGA